MREPFFDKKGASPTPERATKDTRAARRAGAPASTMAAPERAGRKAPPRLSSRRPLPRVPGDKALARLNFFERQRQIEPTQPEKPNRGARRPSTAKRSAARNETRLAARDTPAGRADISPYRAAFARKA